MRTYRLSLLMITVVALIVLSLTALGSQAAAPQTSVVIAAAVGKDPSTGRLGVSVLAFKSTDAVSVKFQGQVHKMQVFKRDKTSTLWLWRSSQHFVSGKCYHYTVDTVTNGKTRSTTVSSMTKNGQGTYCK